MRPIKKRGLLYRLGFQAIILGLVVIFLFNLRGGADSHYGRPDTELLANQTEEKSLIDMQSLQSKAQETINGTPFKIALTAFGLFMLLSIIYTLIHSRSKEYLYKKYSPQAVESDLQTIAEFIASRKNASKGELRSLLLSQGLAKDIVDYALRNR